MRVLLLALLLAGCARSAPGPMVDGPPIDPPPGWSAYCMANPGDPSC